MSQKSNRRSLPAAPAAAGPLFVVPKLQQTSGAELIPWEFSCRPYVRLSSAPTLYTQLNDSWHVRAAKCLPGEASALSRLKDAIASRSAIQFAGSCTSGRHLTLSCPTNYHTGDACTTRARLEVNDSPMMAYRDDATTTSSHVHSLNVICENEMQQVSSSSSSCSSK